MFINKEEALRRLTSANNLASVAFNTPRASAPEPEVARAEIREIDRSRAKGPTLAEEKRTLIAKTAMENPGVKHADLGLIFGVSREEVTKCKSGKIGSRPATEERKAIRLNLANDAKDIALEKLMAALGLLSGEKLAELDSPKDISRFSKDMASVYNSLTASNGTSNGPQVNLIVYAPKSREEGSFKVVDV